MTTKPVTPTLPQAGGSYVVDKTGKPVLQARTVQAHDPNHPEQKAAIDAAAQTPVKDA